MSTVIYLGVHDLLDFFHIYKYRAGGQKGNDNTVSSYLPGFENFVFLVSAYNYE